MDTALPTQSQDLGQFPSGPFRAFFNGTAIRFWEPRRLSILCPRRGPLWSGLCGRGPISNRRLRCHSLLLLSVLAVLANVCYCAAYFVDIPVQSLSVGQWPCDVSAGTVGDRNALAILFENTGSSTKIYPFVR